MSPDSTVLAEPTVAKGRMKKPEAKREFTSSLARGLKVLRAFGRDHPEMTLSEVAAATGLTPATARRCLLTLYELGYVGMNGRRFVLRSQVLALAAAYISSMNLEEIVKPHLQEIVEQTGDNSSLVVREGDDTVYLVHLTAKRMVRLGASVGTRFPVYATSTGRVILAFEGDAAIDAYLQRVKLVPLTNKTVTDPEQLREILRETREKGYAVIKDELDYGVLSVAVPIFDEQGVVVAAINCSTQSGRVSRAEFVRTRLPLLRVAAKRIAEQLRQFPALVHSVESQTLGAGRLIG